MTDVKLLQYAKAELPILVTEFGIVIDVKPLQSKKARFPILVTEFGIVIDVKLLQYKKAYSPIVVTEFGMVTDVKPLQPPKAAPIIFFTLLGIEYWPEYVFGIYTNISLTIIISFSPLQSRKAQLPILVTEFGMVTDVKPMQQ